MDKMIISILLAMMSLSLLVIERKVSEIIDDKNEKIKQYKEEIDALSGVYLDRNDLCKKLK